MSDERYDRSADMRLLDLQRKTLGIPQRVMGSTSYTDPDMLADVSKSDDEPYIQSGTILVAATDARPRAALIPGALVSVSVSISNDGDAAAGSVRLALPLPADTSFRAGSLFVDGASLGDELAGELFGNGMELTDIEPGGRRNLAVKLVIEAGNGDIIVTPHLSVRAGAVLGLRAMRLTRKALSIRGVPSERPFYESDDAEHGIEPIAPSTPVPSISVLQPRENPPPPAPVLPVATPSVKPIGIVAAKPIVAKPASASASIVESVAPAVVKPTPPAVTMPAAKTVAKPPAKVVAEHAPPARTAAKAVTKRGNEAKPSPKKRAGSKTKTAQLSTVEPIQPVVRPKIEVVRSIDDRIAFTGQGGPILSVRIDRRRLATLSGLFGGASLGMVAHYLVLNALAVRDPLPGDGADGAIAAFVASQEQLLSRALIATRLGKMPSPDSVGATLPAFPPALATHTERRAIAAPPAGEALLFRAFAPIEVAFVQRMLSNATAAPFMRAAQLFVGLCANDAVVADEKERGRVGIALTAYAALATAEISRIFLRAKVSGGPALFKATESAFDDAARTVLTSLERSIR